MKKDTPFEWSEDHKRAFEQLKELVTTNTVLKYYNPNSNAVLEVDASIKDLEETSEHAGQRRQT